MELERERRGPILILRINRPEVRNALSPGVISGIGLGMAEADANPDVRVIILTGTGDRAFCAGKDLKAFAAGTGAATTEEERRGQEAFMRFKRDGVRTPVVGAANGTAVAGGFELLLDCDLAVASADAVFGLPEVKRGLVAGGGGVFLGRRIPRAVALELVLTGDTFDAHRALALGLVNRVVPPERVLDEAIDLAERIAANAPLAVAASKRLLDAAALLPRDEVWNLQEQLLPDVFGSDDAREGAMAFVERRAPIWTGR